MAMTIFLALNGLGVVFLLYVLANFWMEGHRPNYNARKYAAEFGERDWSDVAVVTQPISRSARIGFRFRRMRATCTIRCRCRTKT